MSGWHPEIKDGGLLPNPNDPGNPAQAFDPATPPTFASPLYWGNGCDVRLRPHALNTVRSELLAIRDRIGLPYNPAQLTNVREAIEYIVQKGLPKYSVVAGQGTTVRANFYIGLLDPPVLNDYNNGQVVLVLPDKANNGFVRLDLGAGSRPVLRNDTRELEPEDWDQYIPQILGYYNGAWYHLGLVKSQVPIVLKGAIDFWIRPDGNDTTGDGMENTPQRAFRTINGCWAAVGNRYAASPAAHIAMKLGVPGNYEPGVIGPFGAGVSITGDVNNRTAYRIYSETNNPGGIWSLRIDQINYFYLRGVNLVLTSGAPKPNMGVILGVSGGQTVLDRIQCTLEASNNQIGAMTVTYGGKIGASHSEWGYATDIRLVGNGHTINSGCYAAANSMFTGTSYGMPPTIWHYENCNFSNAGYYVHDGSTIMLVNGTTVVSGCTGRRYDARDHSTVHQASLAPGDQEGSLGAFSSAHP